MYKNLALPRLTLGSLRRSINWHKNLGTIIATSLALLLLLLSLVLFNQLLSQQRESRRNEMLLTGWQEQLLTATPAAVARLQLQERLTIEQQRFASASELLPGPDADLAILERINEAAERSGVLLTTLQEVGEFQEGALIGWQYRLAAKESLPRLTDFTARLEQEAFPVAFFADDTILTVQEDEQYLLAGTLVIYGSSFSTAQLALPPTIAPEQMGQELQKRAKQALALQDYELALSLLLQLAALEPENGELDGLLYQTHIQYGLYLFGENRPSLAKEQCEAAKTIDPTDERAINCLLTLQEPTNSEPIAVNGTETMTISPTSGMPPVVTELSSSPVSASPTTTIDVAASRTSDVASLTATALSAEQSSPSPTHTNTASPTIRLPSATSLPPTIAPPPTRTAVPPTATVLPTNTVEMSATPSLKPRPSSTNTRLPSATSTIASDKATATISETVTPATPTITGTPPTGTTATATPTVTGTPPTATGTTAPTTGTPATPTAGSVTATVTNNSGDGHPYGALSAFYLPNCGLTQIKGTIRDQSHVPINGVTVRVWYDGARADEIYSLPTGQDPAKAAGEWDVVLAPYPKEGQWYVQVIDPNTAAALSAVQTVYTDLGPCKPHEAGHQVVIVDFVKYSHDAPGQPVPTSTITHTPTSTLTPSKTPILSATPTRTATFTPTPTRTAIPMVYARVHNPDLNIPDGPATAGTPKAVSTINVPDDIIIERIRVYPDIEHDDIGDLEINLIHPDGTSIRLHNRDENPGEDALQRWIDITGADLGLVAGKSALGEWQLEIIDRYEGDVGVLRNWQLEIYSPS